MKFSRWLKSDVGYAKDLVRAGLDGVGSARKAGQRVTPVSSAAVWAPATVGAVLGAFAACLTNKRTCAYRAVVGGVLGSAVGLGSGVAWASRDLTRAAARSALRNVNTVRDLHWLEKNPIAYA